MVFLRFLFQFIYRKKIKNKLSKLILDAVRTQSIGIVYLSKHFLVLELMKLLQDTIGKYSGEILTIELFMVPYSTYWSHFTLYNIKCDQKVEDGTIKSLIVR